MRKHPSLTADSIARELNLTLSAVRQQLNTMKEEGIVEVNKERSKPGRPIHHYVLTKQADNEFPNVYEKIVQALLDMIKETGGNEILDQLAAKGNEFSSEVYQKAVQGIADPEMMLNELVEFQNRFGFMAELEEEEEKTHLVHYNCPLIRLAEKYPIVCESERQAFEKALGRPVKLCSSRAQGDHKCVFQIDGSERV